MTERPYNETMLTINRDFRWALLGISALSGLGYVISTYTPDTPLLIFIFLFLLAIATYSWSLFIIPNNRIALLATLFVVALLLLRLFHLRHPLYAVLLLASLIAQKYFWK